MSTIAACLLAVAACSSQPVSVAMHIGESRQKFDALTWHTASVTVPVLDWGRWTLSHTLEAGRIQERRVGGGSILLWGPGLSYHWPRNWGEWQFDFQVKPTYLAKAHFNGDDLGGHFHFSSHVGVAWVGRSGLRLEGRYLHVSNAGTQSTNPGVNFAILGVGVRF